MEWSKVLSVFFVLMALTTVVGYIYDGDVFSLIMAISMNLIATTLKLGSRTTLGNELFAASLVADLHLIPAAIIHFAAPERGELAIAMAIGAVVANGVGVLLVVIETVMASNRPRKSYWS